MAKTRGSRPQIKSRVVGDLNEARKRYNKRGGDNAYALTVKADSELPVRFLDEPQEWREVLMHWLDYTDPHMFPCVADGCVGCEEGDRPTRKFVARVIDIADQRVRFFVMPTSVWKILTSNPRRGYEAHGTILDRNYVIVRTGSGKMDTEYLVEEEQRSTFSLKKYRDEIKEADIDAFLEGLIPKDEDEEEVDDNPRRRSSGRTAGGSAGKRSSRLDSAPRRTSRQHTLLDDDDDDTPPRPRRTVTRTGGDKPRRRIVRS